MHNNLRLWENDLTFFYLIFIKIYILILVINSVFIKFDFKFNQADLGLKVFKTLIPLITFHPFNNLHLTYSLWSKQKF